MNYFPVGSGGSLETTFLGFDKKLKGFIIENVDRFAPSMSNLNFVVCNNEIYGVYRRLYRLTPMGWKSVSNSDTFTPETGQVVVLNNEIHILYNTTHKKWDGTQWVTVSTLPYKFYGVAVVYNDEIYILGGRQGAEDHHNYVYKFNGTTWTRLANLPSCYMLFGCVVYHGKIHIMGGRYSSNSTTTYESHYSFDGVTWTNETSMPKTNYAFLTTVYEDKIHVIGGNDTNMTASHYTWDGTSWTRENDINIDSMPLTNGVALVYGGRLRIFCRIPAVLVEDKWYYIPYINSETVNGDGGNIIIPVLK